MIWVLVPLAALFALSALRMRARLAALTTMAPSDAPVAAAHRFFTAPGVTLDDATRRAASAHALANGLEVVDLIPGDLPTIAALSISQLVDPATYRKDRLAVGRTAGHALVCTAEVAERARAEAPADEIGRGDQDDLHGLLSQRGDRGGVEPRRDVDVDGAHGDQHPRPRAEPVPRERGRLGAVGDRRADEAVVRGEAIGGADQRVDECALADPARAEERHRAVLAQQRPDVVDAVARDAARQHHRHVGSDRLER